MKFLTEAELRKLDDKGQLKALQDLVDGTGQKIDITDDADLVALYLDNVPKVEDGKMQITALESVVFKDDDGKRRTLLKGQKALVGAKVAEQMRGEGLVE